MICIQLSGGLGNQMFQYSCGRALAIQHNTDLVLDISQLVQINSSNGQTLRQFELDIFDVDAQIADSYTVRTLKPLTYRLKNVFSLYTRLKGIQTTKYFIEDGPGYNSAINNISMNCYLSGYWQSQKYFIQIEDIIRNDFKFKKSIEGRNSLWHDKIRNSNSISVHIRRSDYVNNMFHDIHGTCSLNYYKESIQYIISRVQDPYFFIFSDDVEWARNNLKIEHPYEFIFGNSGKNSFIDMQLMSMCKHNIIANSSFSWWGAWLNSNSDKIVIAPEKWFSDEKLNLKTIDLVPDSWLRI
jgi:hypothetical protein